MKFGIAFISYFGPSLLLLLQPVSGNLRGDGLTSVRPTDNSTDIITDTDTGPTSSSASSGVCPCPPELPRRPTVICTDYVSPNLTEKLAQTEAEVLRLGRQLDEYNETVVDLLDDLETVKSQLNATQCTLESVLAGSVVITLTELTLFRQELSEMSLILERVEQATSDLPEVQQLRDELDNLTSIVGAMKVTHPDEVVLLRLRMEELKARLAECERRSAGSRDDDSLFQPWNDSPSQDSCSDLIHVSEPFTVRGRGGQTGAWFRDPVLNYSMVWYVPFHNSRYTSQYDRFANVAEFQRGTRYESRYLLPTSLPARGPGMAAYNGSLYFHVDRTRDIVRYDTTNRSVAARRTLRTAVVNNEASYTTAGYTDIDFSVDEFGLWIIYVQTADTSATVLSRLNPETLEIIQTWSVPYPKYQVGNCFMICAKLYCINNHFSHSAKIKFVYDTLSDDLRLLDVPFDNRFGATTSLEYCPRDQKLYGWDNGHQVLYDLTFDPRDTLTPPPPSATIGDIGDIEPK